jgi:hypothetical protein
VAVDAHASVREGEELSPAAELVSDRGRGQSQRRVGDEIGKAALLAVVMAETSDDLFAERDEILRALSETAEEAETELDVGRDRCSPEEGGASRREDRCGAQHVLWLLSLLEDEPVGEGLGEQ